ncbi:MAG: cytochrome c, partial [Chloroflexi bacterium]
VAFLILLPFLRGEETAALPEVNVTPAGPPLQVNPSDDLARLRATQQANLNENALVPIDQAMEMIIENGLPAALSGESAAETEEPSGESGLDVVQQGETIFQDQGCGSCHTQADTALAPTLVGIFGGQETLEGGESVSVDEAYLLQSIVDPHSQIVEGYSAVMPDIYEQRLSEEDITALVEYIKSLGE